MIKEQMMVATDIKTSVFLLGFPTNFIILSITFDRGNSFKSIFCVTEIQQLG
jgi:hypothetical protein